MTEVSDLQLYSCRMGFPKSVVVSIGVSKVGKTPVVFIEKGTKINQEYYCSHVLASLILEIDNLADSDYVFMQNSVSHHTAKSTVEYLNT